MIKRGLSKERLKKFNIKKNDMVLVIAGDEKGKRGRVLHVRTPRTRFRASLSRPRLLTAVGAADLARREVQAPEQHDHASIEPADNQNPVPT